MAGGQMIDQNAMYLVRLHLKTGAVVGYLYMDMGRGHLAKETVAKAIEVSRRHPPQPAIFHVHDDAGQEAHWDGADLSGVSFTDSMAEVVFNTRLEIMSVLTKRDLLQRAGISLDQGAPEPALQPANGQDHGPAQPVGRIGGFAS